MICSAASSWVIYAINGVLCLSAILVIVLMQKAEHDKSINRIDSKWLRSARRLSFIAVAAAVVIMLLSDVSPLALLLLIVSTDVLLIVDIVGLQHRPPAGGLKVSSASHVRSAARQFATLRQLFMTMRRR